MADVRVRSGQLVYVRFTNDDTVFRDWMIAGVPNVDLPARPGQTTSLRFMAPAPGRYEITSTGSGGTGSGGTGRSGTGVLVVEPAS
jgi:heme/copper-type cytochrome/quinol oxidase subunit 2